MEAWLQVKSIVNYLDLHTPFFYVTIDGELIKWMHIINVGMVTYIGGHYHARVLRLEFKACFGGSG